MPPGQKKKKPNRKQKQQCNKFNKDFKSGPHQKNLKKKKRLNGILRLPRKNLTLKYKKTVTQDQTHIIVEELKL